MDETIHERRETRDELQATSDEARATSDGQRATRCCRHCVYARRPTGKWLRLILSRWPGLRICTNHPDAPGDILGVPAHSSCPNFRARGERRVKAAVSNPVGPVVCQIPLTKGKIAMVDAADYVWLRRYPWCLSERPHGTSYAATHTRGKVITMHRLIMNPPKGLWVHHRDDNGLNNCRDNLCICTPQQNARRRRRRKDSTSHFIGVFQRKEAPGKWYGEVEAGRQHAYVGPFDDEIEAARARDRKALELHGSYAMLNFPEERDQRIREIEAEKRDLDTDSHG
ncbi:MAG: HNH endonuclease [Phycisphaerae bacterium]|nr:HNH endonuclease [Phycisphaerae bacterium]